MSEVTYSDHFQNGVDIIKAAGGKVNVVSFTKGEFDIVPDMNLPSQEMMIRAMVTVKASELIEKAMYLECIEML